MHSICREFTIDVAHKLDLPYTSKCLNLHGHTVKISINLYGTLNSNGMIIDFNDIKRLFENPIKEKFDHKLILAKDTEFCNKIIQILPECSYVILDIPNTTSEYLAEYICKFIYSIIKNEKLDNINAIKIMYAETDNNKAFYCMNF